MGGSIVPYAPARMKRLRVLVLVLSALSLAACGEEGITVAKDGRIVIRIDDFRLTPQVVRARAGVLTIELRNDGRLGHAFHLRRNGRLWLEEKRLAPGERRVVSRRLERGDYRAFDPLANFEVLGLYGTLSVR